MSNLQSMTDQYPQLSPPYTTPNDVLRSRIGKIFIYDTFLIIKMHEGVMINYKSGLSLLIQILGKVGSWYIVYMYLDELTQRLVGSSKTNKYVSNDTVTVEKFDQVEILVTHITEKGANAIVNGLHHGLIYIDDIFEDIRTGDRIKAYVKKVREDNKIDLVLQAPGYRSIEPNANFVLDELKAAGGFLALHDKSDPDAIKDQLGMSKKSFKKAIGSLYKDKQIVIKEDGIELIS